MMRKILGFLGALGVVSAPLVGSSDEIVRLLKGGDTVFGTFSGNQTEQDGAAAGRNLESDFVFYSMERGSFDTEKMARFAEAMRTSEVAVGAEKHPFVLRVPPVFAIEEGARVPPDHREEYREAAAAVDAMGSDLWPTEPDGKRVNMLIIEDRQGVENAREIVATPGVSVVFAGPGDLSRAYDGDTQAVENAIQTILSACQEYDVPCGITAEPDDVATRLNQGFLVIIATRPETIPIGKVAARQRSEEIARRTAERRRQRELAVQKDLAAVRPIAALDSVWIEELTWMEVRDLLAGGTTTAIVSTGGIEQNGPYLATGKHNVVLMAACEGIARTLGNALCAPIIKLVPEGDIEEPTGHMLYPGTLSLRQETFRAVLEDVASSLEAHGFEHIILIGDSGGNQAGMKTAAETLNRRWGETIAHYVPEFYEYEETIAWMNDELGVTEPIDEGLHDDFATTAMMMAVDPESVRYQQRVDAGRASINGVPIAPLEKTVAIGKKLLHHRVDHTVKAILKAIGSTANQR